MTRIIFPSRNLEKGSKPADPYECRHDWGESFVQAGGKGIVFTASGDYYTAFFEAFPRDPDTFIRGEGPDISRAEDDCWNQYQKFLSCPAHEFERRGYTNGGGICKHCGMWKSKAFDPSTLCFTCHKPTYFTNDKDGNYYCEDHQRDKPLEKWDDLDWHIAHMTNEMNDWERTRS